MKEKTLLRFDMSIIDCNDWALGSFVGAIEMVPIRDLLFVYRTVDAIGFVLGCVWFGRWSCALVNACRHIAIKNLASFRVNTFFILMVLFDDNHDSSCSYLMDQQQRKGVHQRQDG